MNPSAHPAALAAALVIALASGLRAQEAANATTKWRLTYHTHISAWVSDDEEIFDTRAEAERKAAILRQTNASNDPGSPVPFTNIRIAPITVPAAAASGVAALIADVEGRLGRIGESLDHLHEVATEILDAAERKPGAALADYANSIRDAYRRVSDLREKLLARQTELGKDAIRAANRRIDEYNAQADAFNAFLRSPPNSVRLAMVPTRRAPRPNGSFRGNRTPVEQTAPLTLPQPAQRIERLNEPTASATDSPPQASPQGEDDRNQGAGGANDGKQMTTANRRADNLVDKVWGIDEDGVCTTIFYPDGTMTRFVAACPVSGNPACKYDSYTWTRDGNTIVVREGDDYVFRGTIDGNQIDGVVYYEKYTKQFRQIWRVVR